MLRLVFKRLYAIHNAQQQPISLAELKQFLKRRPALCQYRQKKPYPMAVKIAEARSIKRLCLRYAVPLIINDDLILARRINADGVHLGQGELRLMYSAKKHFLKRQGLIGISCQDNHNKAKKAKRLGASYVSFGAVFPSQTKPDASLAKRCKIRYAIKNSSLPCVVIGGITPAKIAHLRLPQKPLIAVSAAISLFNQAIKLPKPSQSL